VNNSQLASARAELAGALEALEELATVVAEGVDAFRASADRRQRARYLWIVVGSRLKNYCQLMGIARATGVLGQAIGFRHTLAYLPPSRVDDDIVWRTSTDDRGRLAEAVRETLRALPVSPPTPSGS
jgi:hypothetical protein